MDRSLAARSLVGRAGVTLPRRGARRRRAARTIGLPGAHAIRRAGSAALSFVAAHRRLRVLLIGVLVAIPLLLGGWLLLRHSPLVSVHEVRVSGVHGPQAAEIDAALTAAAMGMSTLDVHPAALRAAVERFHVVSAVKAIASFPHGLHIEVSEQPAVAALLVAGARTAVAANGVALGGDLVTSALPTVAGYTLPEPGHRVDGPNVLAALAILGAAPAPLAHHVTRAYAGPEGITVVMGDGLLVYFGNASRPHAKWLSLARVLADPSSAGASYIDVRLPARPAAGFPAGVSPPGATTTGGETSSAELSGNSESTIAALAAGLSAGTGSSGAAAATSAAPAEAASAPASEPPAQAGGGAGEPAAAEAQATGAETQGGGTTAGG